MPDLPPEAVRDASCDLAALSQDWVGYAWPAELTDKIVHTVWAALLPHLGELVAQRIEALCPFPNDEHAGNHCPYREAADTARQVGAAPDTEEKPHA